MPQAPITLSLPRLLPLAEAAQALGVDVQTLQNQVQSGQIAAFLTPQGEVMVAVTQNGEPLQQNGNNQEQRPRRKEDTPEYQAVAHLKGRPIWISEAARKYGLNHQTLLNWVKRGIVRRLGREKNRVLLDEADVAYCATIYHKRGGKRGQRLFDKDGLPYQPKWKPKSMEVVPG